MTQLIGRISSTAITVPPAPQQYRSLQRQKILELAEKQSCNARVELPAEVRGKNQWWIKNLMLSEGRAVISPSPQLIITSDASLQGWEHPVRDKQQEVHAQQRNRKTILIYWS